MFDCARIPIANIAILGLLLSGCASLGGGKDKLMHGWRYPGRSDYEDDWEEYRLARPTPFHITGDFDGNGVNDDVWILLEKQSEGWGVFAFLHFPDAPTKVIEILSFDEEGAQDHGLLLSPTGKYRTECGRDPTSCKQGQAPQLEFKYPGVVLFEYEGGSQTFHWNPSICIFEKVDEMAYGTPDILTVP